MRKGILSLFLVFMLMITDVGGAVIVAKAEGVSAYGVECIRYGMTLFGKPSFQRMSASEAAESDAFVGEQLRIGMLQANSKAKGKSASFFEALRVNLMKRYTSFSVSYDGSVKDIPSDETEFMEGIRAIDDKSTSDDSDFLLASIMYIQYSCRYSATKAVYTFTVTYTDDAKQVKALNKKVKSVLAKLGVNKMSNAAKVKVIHDYVVNLVSYDQTMTVHSAYGGLVDKKHTTVCQGYSLIMYKMLTDAGVPARIVTGYAGERHAWNLVKLSGKWYHLDATWDDPIASRPVLSYNYFLVGSKKMNRDHTLDAVYKKAYKISAADCNWKSAIKKSGKAADKKVKVTRSKKEETESQNAKVRNDYVQILTEDLDQACDYENLSDFEKTVFDLYKKIYGSIICNISDDKFNRLCSGDKKVSECLSGKTADKIKEYILNPAIEYLQSDEFQIDALALMIEEFGLDGLLDMSESEIETLVTTYCFRVFSEKLNAYSQANTERIINEMVKEINKLK